MVAGHHAVRGSISAMPVLRPRFPAFDSASEAIQRVARAHPNHAMAHLTRCFRVAEALHGTAVEMAVDHVEPRYASRHVSRRVETHEMLAGRQAALRLPVAKSNETGCGCDAASVRHEAARAAARTATAVWPA